LLPSYSPETAFFMLPMPWAVGPASSAALGFLASTLRAVRA
jgi:hypothetical protein